MDDLDKYIDKRKKESREFKKNFDKGYEQFKTGVLLKQAMLVGRVKTRHPFWEQ